MEYRIREGRIALDRAQTNKTSLATSSCVIGGATNLAGLHASVETDQKLIDRKHVVLSEFCMSANPIYTVRTYSAGKNGHLRDRRTRGHLYK